MSQSAGWCTNWDAYDLPRLWQMVSGEDDDQGWAQVQAWFRLRSAVNACRERLQACRQALQDQWPPDKSPASAAFIAYIDQLTISMAQTAASAERTAHGLAGIMSALATAKAEMEPLYENWREVSNDLTPRWWDGAEDELNAKARAIMRTAEMAVADYTPMIEIPPKYELRGARNPISNISAGEPGEKGSSTEFGIGTDLAGSLPQVPHHPPPPLPSVDPVSSSGPVLSGMPTSTTHSPSSPSSAPSTNSPIGSGQGSNSGVPISPVPGPLPSDRSTATRSIRGTRVRQIGILPTPLVSPTGSGVRRPTGTTASRSTTAGAPLAIPVAAAKGARERVASARLIAPDNTYRAQHGNTIGLPSQSRRDTECDAILDGTWSVEVGVAPVIIPPQPRPHDPGPGIIGIDR